MRLFFISLAVAPPFATFVFFGVRSFNLRFVDGLLLPPFVAFMCCSPCTTENPRSSMPGEIVAPDCRPYQFGHGRAKAARVHCHPVPTPRASHRGRLSRSIRSLDQQAIKAFAQWELSQDAEGKPVPVRITCELQFTLK